MQCWEGYFRYITCAGAAGMFPDYQLCSTLPFAVLVLGPEPNAARGQQPPDNYDVLAPLLGGHGGEINLGNIRIRFPQQIQPHPNVFLGELPQQNYGLPAEALQWLMDPALPRLPDMYMAHMNDDNGDDSDSDNSSGFDEFSSTSSVMMVSDDDGDDEDDDDGDDDDDDDSDHSGGDVRIISPVNVHMDLSDDSDDGSDVLEQRRRRDGNRMWMERVSSEEDSEDDDLAAGDLHYTTLQTHNVESDDSPDDDIL